MMPLATHESNIKGDYECTSPSMKATYMQDLSSQDPSNLDYPISGSPNKQFIISTFKSRDFQQDEGKCKAD